MRAVMVMFDTLCRRMLPPYGNTQVIAPNFQRLSENSITFDRSYVGSLPCMPARREIHTGRYNFLHRAWGPLEPFDMSMPNILHKNGIHTHMASDHYHYWETGGSTYHAQYTTWEAFRGQEGDQYIGDLHDPEAPETIGRNSGWMIRQDFVNRKYVKCEDDYSLVKTINSGIEFIDRNNDMDNWFLQIELFDPHEPFVCPDEYKALYPDDYNGPEFEWPKYETTDGYTEEEIKRLRKNYMALLTMCDKHLGRVLDAFDRYNLWEDTMLIVNTDHGFLLGEHDYFGKSIMPLYNEIANTPLFIYDPRLKIKNERRQALVQTIDLAPTILEFFGQEIPELMVGKSLFETMKNDTGVRDTGIFGCHCEYLCITDGDYVYMRAPRDGRKEDYTLMPSRMRELFTVEELKNWEWHKGFSFTQGVPVMKICRETASLNVGKPNLLFDLEKDPEQKKQIINVKIENQMIEKIKVWLKDSEAPDYLYEVLELNSNYTDRQI
ncbi:MAG: sulfatase [Clostridiales bacterium 43-6]|nr:MAG: sulfatase [Clostridiales bacterium 43-6]